LAYIPCESQFYSQKQYNKFSTDTKQFRLFQLFEVGLSSFVAAQQAGAMEDIYLPLGGKGKDVNMLVPLSFIVGDNQGGDGITGRAAVYNETARRICRSCNATIDHYDTIESDCCVPLNMEDIMAMVTSQDWPGLHSLHQVPSWNPFFDVCYGGNPGGIFTAACPAEALHALENGLFLHSLKAVLGGCLKPQEIVLLDGSIQVWTKLPRQRLIRSSNFAHSPRLLFKDGISTLTKLPAATKVGMMYALVVAAVTRDGKYAFRKLSDDAYLDILYAFEQCLCYWAWLKKDNHWALNDVAAHQATKDAIAEMLRNLVQCVPRATGRGWHIPKLHEQLHVADTILLFGSHKNVHTGPAEHNHIELSKKPAARTQMRKDTFDWQVSNRLVDKYVVDLSLEYMKQENEPNPTIIPPPGSLPPLPHNTVYFDLMIRPVGGRLHELDISIVNPKKRDKMLPPLFVLQHLVSTCYPLMERGLNPEGVTLHCFTELPLHDTIVRCNPSFDKDGAWFDYVTISLKDTSGASYTTGARVELMYYMEARPDQRFVVVHPAFSFCQTHSVLTTFYRMQYKDDPRDIYQCPVTVDFENEVFFLDDDINELLPEPRLITVGSDCILSHTLMIPYHACSKFMVGVRGQSEWADEFLKTD
jgi:hypothetical protein